MTTRYAVFAEDGSVISEVTEYDGVGEYHSLAPVAPDTESSFVSGGDATSGSGQRVCPVRWGGQLLYVPVLRLGTKNERGKGGIHASR